VRKVVARRPLLEALQGSRSVLRPRLECQNRELVAAQPTDDVRLSEGLSKETGQSDQVGRPALMTERIVDGLEVVEVEEVKAGHLPGPFGELERLLGQQAESEAVGQPGQVVGEREIRELPGLGRERSFGLLPGGQLGLRRGLQPGVLDGQRRPTGKLFGQLHVLRVVVPSPRRSVSSPMKRPERALSSSAAARRGSPESMTAPHPSVRSSAAVRPNKIRSSEAVRRIASSECSISARQRPSSARSASLAESAPRG
jgi:hypothetical protein